MNLTPGYGETPLPNDELAALLPAARDLLEPSLTKAAVYDLEQEIQDDITETMVSAVLEGNIQLEELVTDFFLRELHFLLYGQVWDWAGKFRRRELNIGVAPEQIAMDYVALWTQFVTDGNTRAIGPRNNLALLHTQKRSEFIRLSMATAAQLVCTQTSFSLQHKRLRSPNFMTGN